MEETKKTLDEFMEVSLKNAMDEGRDLKERNQAFKQYTEAAKIDLERKRLERQKLDSEKHEAIEKAKAEQARKYKIIDVAVQVGLGVGVPVIVTIVGGAIDRSNTKFACAIENDQIIASTAGKNLMQRLFRRK